MEAPVTAARISIIAAGGYFYILATWPRLSFLPWEGLLLAPFPCLVSLGLPGWCCSGAVPVLLRTAISRQCVG
jgi:hypothetical protein